MDDFTAAVERIVAGVGKEEPVLSPDDRRRVAYHEMGHALAAASLSGTDPVHKVSIIPRSIGALGFTMQRPTDDRFSHHGQRPQEPYGCSDGGRAAEDLIFGEVSTGAADDLARATDIARQIVTASVMNKELGQAVFERQGQSYLGGQCRRPEAEGLF